MKRPLLIWWLLETQLKYLKKYKSKLFFADQILVLKNKQTYIHIPKC